MLEAVLAWLNGTDRDWPAAIGVADTVDTGQLARRLRMAAVWAGPCHVGACQAGDGFVSAAVELTGVHGSLTLTLVVDPETGLLQLARRRRRTSRCDLDHGQSSGPPE